MQVGALHERSRSMENSILAAGLAIIRCMGHLFRCGVGCKKMSCGGGFFRRNATAHQRTRLCANGTGRTKNNRPKTRRLLAMASHPAQAKHALRSDQRPREAAGQPHGSTISHCVAAAPFKARAWHPAESVPYSPPGRDHSVGGHGCPGEYGGGARPRGITRRKQGGAHHPDAVPEKVAVRAPKAG